MNDDQKTRFLKAFAIPMGVLFFIGSFLFLISRILLTVSVDAAPMVALLVALVIFAGAATIALRPKIDTRQAMGIAGAFFVLIAAGGIASWFIGERDIHPHEEGAVIQIAAANVAFDTDTLNVPAGEEFVIEFDNTENVPHNIGIYTEDQSETFFEGEIVTGPTVVEYEVDALEAGEYLFLCDVHPQQMRGTLIAAEFPEGGDAATQNISAQNLQFSTTELRFPPEQNVTLNFENLEAIPHNVSLYVDESAAEEIFVGEILSSEGEIAYEFESPAPGEYYFHCDVHPTQMFGTVIIQ